VDCPFQDTVNAASWFDSNGLSDADRAQIGPRLLSISLTGP